jgi:teichuronic acid biosynthesis glycosyltransferase TuaH
VKIVYFSPVNWESVAQRPHFFVKSALEYGFSQVLWINPTPSRLPNRSDLLRIKNNNKENSFPCDKRIKIITPKVLPIEPFGKMFDFLSSKEFCSVLREIESFSDENTYFISGKPSRLLSYIVENTSYKMFILDIMDDYPEFYSGISKKSMSATLRRLIKYADLCLFSSDMLNRKFGGMAKKSAIVKNACDEDFLNNIRCKKVSRHSDVESDFVSPKKVFGYIGSLAKWFDWNAVIKLAKLYPSYEVKLIGPTFGKIPKNLPINIVMFPSIEHSLVSDELLTFDYGLIPFKVNELTDSVDPVKYYEYCAANLIVVSSRFGEMRNRIDEGYAIDIEKFDIGMRVDTQEAITWRQRFFPFFEQYLGI